MQDWVAKKHAECHDPKKPDKPFGDGSNWMLTERWIVKHKGQIVKNETKMTEGMDKKADSMASGLSLVPDGESGKTQSKSMAEKHKDMMKKINGGLSKLSKSILSCEAGLPQMKRRLSEPTYSRMKRGLTAMMDKKHEFMDKAEDFKTVPSEDGLLELMVDQMAELHKAILSDQQALQEAMQKHHHVKDEVPAEHSQTEEEKEEGDGGILGSNKWIGPERGRGEAKLSLKPILKVALRNPNHSPTYSTPSMS